MPRRPFPSFDYEYLAGFQANEDNPHELYYLSPASQKVLAQLAEIVLWRDTRWYNGDQADIIALSGQIYEELKVPQHLDDLIPLLDDIEPLLTQLLARPCCENLNQGQTTGGDGGSIYPIPGPFPYPIPDNDTSPGVGEYPITPATDPDESGTMTETEWYEYACGVANWLFDSVIDWLNFARFLIGLQYGTVQLIDMIVGQIAAAALPGQLDDLAVWTLPTYTEIFTEWGQSITQGTIDTAVSQLDAIRDDIICGIAGHYTAEGAIAAILNLISGEITSAGILALLESPIALVASLAWNGLIDTPWDDGCNCIIDPAPFELVNVVTVNAGGLTDTPTWTEISDYVWNFDWTRVPADANAEQPNLRIDYIFNTVDCLDSGALTVDYAIRIQGTFDDPSGNPASGSITRRHGAADNCPATGAPPSPGTSSGETMNRNVPINILQEGSFSIAADTTYMSIGLQLPNLFVNNVDLTFTLESLEFS